MKLNKNQFKVSASGITDTQYLFGGKRSDETAYYAKVESAGKLAFTFNDPFVLSKVDLHFIMQRNTAEQDYYQERQNSVCIIVNSQSGAASENVLCFREQLKPAQQKQTGTDAQNRPVYEIIPVITKIQKEFLLPSSGTKNYDTYYSGGISVPVNKVFTSASEQLIITFPDSAVSSRLISVEFYGEHLGECGNVSVQSLDGVLVSKYDINSQAITYPQVILDREPVRSDVEDFDKALVYIVGHTILDINPKPVYLNEENNYKQQVYAECNGFWAVTSSDSVRFLLELYGEGMTSELSGNQILDVLMNPSLPYGLFETAFISKCEGDEPPVVVPVIIDHAVPLTLSLWEDEHTVWDNNSQSNQTVPAGWGGEQSALVDIYLGEVNGKVITSVPLRVTRDRKWEFVNVPPQLQIGQMNGVKNAETTVSLVPANIELGTHVYTFTCISGIHAVKVRVTVVISNYLKIISPPRPNQYSSPSLIFEKENNWQQEVVIERLALTWYGTHQTGDTWQPLDANNKPVTNYQVTLLSSVSVPNSTGQAVWTDTVRIEHLFNRNTVDAGTAYFTATFKAAEANVSDTVNCYVNYALRFAITGIGSEPNNSNTWNWSKTKAITSNDVIASGETKMYALDEAVLNISISANTSVNSGNAMSAFQYTAGGDYIGTATAKTGFIRSVKRKADNWALHVENTMSVQFYSYYEYYFNSSGAVSSRTVTPPAQTIILILRNRHILQGLQPPNTDSARPLDVHLIWDYNWKRTVPVFTNPNCVLSAAADLSGTDALVSITSPEFTANGTDFFEFIAKTAAQTDDYAVYKFTLTSAVPDGIPNTDFEGVRTLTAPLTIRVLKTGYTQTGLIEPMTAVSGNSHWKSFSQNNMLSTAVSGTTALLNADNFASRANTHSFEVTLPRSVVRALSYTMPELSGNSNPALGFFIEYKADEDDVWHPLSNSTVFCRKVKDSVPSKGIVIGYRCVTPVIVSRLRFTVTNTRNTTNNGTQTGAFIIGQLQALGAYPSLLYVYDQQESMINGVTNDTSPQKTDPVNVYWDNSAQSTAGRITQLGLDSSSISLLEKINNALIVNTDTRPIGGTQWALNRNNSAWIYPLIQDNIVSLADYAHDGVVIKGFAANTEFVSVRIDTPTNSYGLGTASPPSNPTSFAASLLFETGNMSFPDSGQSQAYETAGTWNKSALFMLDDNLGDHTFANKSTSNLIDEPGQTSLNEWASTAFSLIAGYNAIPNRARITVKGSEDISHQQHHIVEYNSGTWVDVGYDIIFTGTEVPPVISQAFNMTMDALLNESGQTTLRAYALAGTGKDDSAAADTINSGAAFVHPNSLLRAMYNGSEFALTNTAPEPVLDKIGKHFYKEFYADKRSGNAVRMSVQGLANTVQRWRTAAEGTRLRALIGEIQVFRLYQSADTAIADYQINGVPQYKCLWTGQNGVINYHSNYSLSIKFSGVKNAPWQCCYRQEGNTTTSGVIVAHAFNKNTENPAAFDVSSKDKYDGWMSSVVFGICPEDNVNRDFQAFTTLFFM